MSVTLADIAEKSSLSTVTVSHILRGAGTVRPETRKRVLEMARELGYHPNSAARAMRKGRFDTVGLLFRNDSYNIDLPPAVIAGIADTLEAKDLKTVLIKTPDDMLIQANSLPGISNRFMVDGFIVSCWGIISDELREMASTAVHPVCWVNSDSKRNSVRPDDRGAGKMATDHLLRMGHRKIAYVDYSGSPHFSATDRSDGYSAAMAEAGLSPWMIKRGIAVENRFEGSCELFSGDDRPSAIVACCSYDAQPIIYCASRFGLRVPQDLSVITFEGKISNSMGIPISSAIFPEREIGVEAAKMLLSRIENNGAAMPSVVVPFKKILGNTCEPFQLNREACQKKTDRLKSGKNPCPGKRRKLQ